MYSLMLSDDVVSAVDRAAYMRGTNRSNMINQILAEYLSLTTPEQRVKQVFDRMTALLGMNDSGYGAAGYNEICAPDTFKIALTQSESVMSLRSALEYKYNPTVRYSIELYRDMEPAVGELRVSLRTQNSMLIRYITDFFLLWTKLEEHNLGKQNCTVEEGKYSREFRIPKHGTGGGTDVLGELIAEYIGMFDRALKLYFKNLDEPTRTIPEINDMLRRYAERLGK